MKTASVLPFSFFAILLAVCPVALADFRQTDDGPSAGAAVDAVHLTVRNRRAPLLEKPRMLGARVLRMLGEGDVVVVVDPSQAAKVRAGADKTSILRRGRKSTPEIVWYRVSPLSAPATVGYMHHTVLIAGRLTIDPSGRVSARASGEEVVLAGRGFDEAVEREYQRSHAELGAAFALLDAIDSDPLYDPTLDDVQRFVEAGRLRAASAGAGARGEEATP